ncbi:uncharacterized protein LOC143020821 isoform X2 [Oratosquilla oratoria]|uniref:uncharacterized protein LOC143020821 isoform X2 n=1 Tax=Oratosquilla oratoria TaxID=337810 RepID=UPI003F75EADB
MSMRDGTTPLILAAANSHVSIVKELLDQGADPNMTRHTGTGAIFFAAQGGFLDIVTMLLDNGVNIHQASKDGGTALVVAAQCGHQDVVEFLLEKGANANVAMRDRASTLFVAAQNGHTGVVKALLKAGARVNTRRVDGATPLWIASQMGHHQAVRILLANGAFHDTPRHDGATPLLKAAHKGHIDVIQELLPYKPSLGLLKNGESALHAAALSGDLRVTKTLLAAGADSSLKNDQGLTPVQIAVQSKHYDCASTLKEDLAKRRERAKTASPATPTKSPPPTDSSPGSPRVVGSPKPTPTHVPGRCSTPTSPAIVQSQSSGQLLDGESSPTRAKAPPRSSTQFALAGSSSPLSRGRGRGVADQYMSCELSTLVDGSSRPPTTLVVGSCGAMSMGSGPSTGPAPSPNPSISSEPVGSHSRHNGTERSSSRRSGDFSSVKSIFHKTLASFKRSSLRRRSSKDSPEP